MTDPKSDTHYTDGRRWSYISNAWIFESDWNDKEEIARLKHQLTALQSVQGRDVESQYYELLYAVARKFPGESRHATALRYIQEAERTSQGCEPAQANPQPTREGG